MGALWQAAAETFAAPVVGAVLSPLSARGKGPVAETSASDNSLTTPRFVSTDFETQMELIPFVKGVSHLVSPASGPSPFAKLNEFDEGCTAIKSLLVLVTLMIVSF